VLGEFKKGYRGEPLNRQNLKLELGDVLWYVAVCAHELDLTLSELATANINKLAARYGSARPEAPGTCQPSQCI
jgi:NTP pyrophosphatase (non-canonical NTP hydrolase)